MSDPNEEGFGYIALYPRPYEKEMHLPQRVTPPLPPLGSFPSHPKLEVGIVQGENLVLFAANHTERTSHACVFYAG